MRFNLNLGNLIAIGGGQMKAWQKRVLSIVMVVALALCATPWLTRNQTTTAAQVLDMVNPVVQEETVYVSTKDSAVQWHANNHGGLDYRYEVQSYTADGIPRKLELDASDRPLDANAYLAVVTKGQTVLRWHEVPRSQVPTHALKHLMY
jgi:uncharacterized protein (TIGR01655 family)